MERRASLPDQLPPDELTLQSAQEMLDKAQQGDQPLGVCPETGRPIFVKVGRFGPYVQRGTADDDEKPQNASLLKGMEPDQVTLEIAVQLLSLPKTLGNDPASGEPVVAHNGRYGPYVKCGEETRSLPADYSPLTVTLEQALQLLAQPKVRRGASASKEPLKVFDASPVTGQPIRLMQGRFGPYVTDGVTNASIPRDMAPEDVTKELALELLAKRAAAGPSKRATRKKAAASKPKAKAVKKKAAKPRAKTAKKKTAKVKKTPE